VSGSTILSAQLSSPSVQAARMATWLLCARPVEARRRVRAQRPPLLGEVLGDREAPARVGADVCPAIAPVGVLAVELGERREAPRRSEAALEVADGRFD
jgi:hypothetical protein